MSEVRSLSLGTEGERTWQLLSANYQLGPGRGCAMLVSDSGDVRSEVRQRMESMAPATFRLEPSREVLAKVHEIAAAAARDRPPLVWIEVAESSDPQAAWGDALTALNRGRDLVWDAGPVYVVLAGPEWLHQRLREGAPDLSSTIRVAVLDDTLELLAEPTEPLCWLHLSDLHIGSEDWQLDVVLSALKRDLPGLLERAQRKPQLLFVTGDVANRGREIEYDGAFRFLDELCELLGLGRERVFLVPGNHDVDRGKITKAVQRSEKLLFDALERDEDEFRTAIGEIIGDPDEMRRYGVRLAAWSKFVGDFLGMARGVSIDQPWRSDIVEVAGVRVGVASICSAWLSGHDDAKGRLVVGERQVRQLVDELRDGDAQLRVALLHHPIEWLREAEGDTIQRLLRNEFDVILHGHQHKPKAVTVVHGRDTVESGAGATYAGLGRDRYHGFQVAQLDIAAENLVIDAFTWTTRNEHWHLDAGFDRDAPNGRMTLPLRLTRFGCVNPRPNALAARLRRAAQHVHDTPTLTGLSGWPGRPNESLRDTFVSLQLSKRGHERPRVELETLRAAWLGEVPARAVILGDPGGGKSTICRYIAATAAEIDGGPVPLLLTVRDWTGEGVLEWVLRHIEQHLSIRTDLKTLEGMLAQERAMLIVDGIDEAGMQQRELLRDRLHAVIDAYPKIGVVVTSRALGYDTVALDEHRFEHYVLEPFDDERLRDFVTRCYTSHLSNDVAERRRHIGELWAALEADPRTMALARNPLLARVIVLVHEAKGQLPGFRVRLYEECIEVLVVSRPNLRGQALSDLDGDKQIFLLAKLAYWILSSQRGIHDGGVLVERTTLLEKLEDLLGESVVQRKALARKWLRWLTEVSALIQEQEQEKFGFLHLSLMEYLASQGLLMECDSLADRIQLIDDHLFDPHWREVLLFMVCDRGNDRNFCNAVVRHLLDAGAVDSAGFALAMMRENVELDGELPARILDAIVRDVFGGEPWDWIEPSHLLADVVRVGGRNSHRKCSWNWLEHAIETRDGEELAAVLTIAPFDDALVKILERRISCGLDLQVVMTLGGTNEWGKWARMAASPRERLRWVMETPLLSVVWRSMSALYPTDLCTRVPNCGDLVAVLIARACRVGKMFGLASSDGVATIWSTSVGDFMQILHPAFMVDCDCTPTLIPPHWVEQYDGSAVASLAHRVAADIYGPDNATLRQLVTTVFIFTVWPAVRPVSEEYVRAEPEGTLRTLLRASRYPHQDDVRILSITPDPRIHPSLPTDAGDPSTVPPSTPDDAKFRRFTTTYLTQQAIDVHGGLLVDPVFATFRAQNRWISTFLSPLVDYTTRESPLNPQQHALFLALGLAQFQTTWSWPAGPHWHAWFTADPPEYWLAAYVWHLCWAVGDPSNSDHLTRAHACLDRGDDPELVAELRKYPIIPTPPEVYALFDGSGGEPPSE
ncbi:metallophosphoesterase [Nannocystaceae bacterium ST9]